MLVRTDERIEAKADLRTDPSKLFRHNFPSNMAGQFAIVPLYFSRRFSDSITKSQRTRLPEVGASAFRDGSNGSFSGAVTVPVAITLVRLALCNGYHQMEQSKTED